MADVTAASTSAGGLGTSQARSVFVFVWLCGVWLGFVEDYFTPLDPLNASAYAAGLVGGFLLTSPGSRPLPLSRALWIPACALYLTIIALSRAPDVMDVAALNFAAYLVAFLIPRGNPATGAVGSALVFGYALTWGLITDPSGADLASLLGIPAGSVAAGILWRVVLQWIVRSERAHRSTAGRAADRATASDEAAVATRRELAEIRAAVEPLLIRIAAGETIDDGLRAKLTSSEASIRDQIRAPHLMHPLLVDELVRLRRRGVTVVLLGESTPGAGVIETPLARRITELISPLTDGRATIRSLPEKSPAAVSVVVQTPDASEQTLLGTDGRVLSRA